MLVSLNYFVPTHDVMKAYIGSEGKFHAFLTLALDQGEWLASLPGSLSPGNSPCNHWIGGRMDPRADLEAVEKRKIPCLPWFELRSFRP
jgi:hypothetical protein